MPKKKAKKEKKAKKTQIKKTAKNMLATIVAIRNIFLVLFYFSLKFLVRICLKKR